MAQVDVADVVAHALEHALLLARHHLDGAVAFEIPAGHVDVVGEHVVDGGGRRRALQDLHELRARIVDALLDAEDLAEPALQDLLLGQHPAALVAARVADADLGAGALRCLDDGVGVGQRERQRLLDEHGLAGLQRLHHGLAMVVLGRGDEHGIDGGMLDGGEVVGGGEIGADALRQDVGLVLLAIGDGEKIHAGMRRRQAGAQRADAAAADHGDADGLHPFIFPGGLQS